MIVNRTSWHARMYKWFDMDTENPEPTVCTYVAKCTVVPIFFGVFCVIAAPIFGLIWVGSKVSKKYKERYGEPKLIAWVIAKTENRTFCPFGKVEFK